LRFGRCAAFYLLGRFRGGRVVLDRFKGSEKII